MLVILPLLLTIALILIINESFYMYTAKQNFLQVFLLEILSIDQNKPKLVELKFLHLDL